MWKLVAFCCAVLFNCVVNTADTFIALHAQDDQWYPVGSTAVLTCMWEYSNENITTDEVLSWKADGQGIRRITRDDSSNSFVFGNSVISADRQTEETDFVSDVKVGKLSIMDFRVSDPEEYICEVEVNQVQKSQPVKAKAYDEPDVYIVDVVTEVDLRDPIEDVTTGNVTEARPTESTQEAMIEVKCIIDRAFPEPSKVEFIIGESEKREATGDMLTITQGDDSYYSGVATLQLGPDAMYDGKSISCETTLPVEPQGIVTQSTNISSQIQVYHETTRVSITITPETAAVGEEVTVTCVANGNPSPTFRLQPDEMASQDGDNFIISSVTKAHSGEYHCIALVLNREDDTYHEITSDSARLNIEYMEEPTLSIDDEEITLNLGESVSISCQGSGNPTPSLEWKKDGAFYSDDYDISIDNADYENAGVYTCESTSASSLVSGVKTRSVEVKVQGACEATFEDPIVTSSQTAEFRYKVMMKCTVTGSPACSVSMVPQRNFKPQGNFSNKGNGVYTLVYDQLEQFSQAISFFCVATNNIGQSNVSRTLDENDGGICCQAPKTSGLSTGAVIGIILLVLVVLVGIPVACYFVKKRNAQPKKKAPVDAEEAEPEKEELNKDASSEDSDTGSLPPPPADMEHDHRLNSAHEMTTFSTNK